MPRPLRFANRRAVAWLLAVLLPLQTLAAAAVAMAGPSHVHRAAATQLVLDDFRRMPVRSVRLEAHAAGASGHVHAGAAAERHPHLPGDATVLAHAHEAQQAADAGDFSAGASLGAFCGLVSSPPAWLSDGTGERPASTARWTPNTHHPALPERPPRAV